MTDRNQIFFTAGDLAVRWSMSKRSLEGWRLKGRGPTYHKIGASVRYHIEDIERFERAWTSYLNDTS